MIASIADHGRGERANRRGPRARERAIKRGRAGTAVGRGRDVSGARGRWGELGLGRARGRGRGERLGPESAQPRGREEFLFLFLFLFPSLFCFLLFYNLFSL
jgi:hypothetical protein